VVRRAFHQEGKEGITMTQPVKWEIAPRRSTYQAIPANECDRETLAAAGKLTFPALSIGIAPSGPQVAIVPLDESSVEHARMIAALPELLYELKAFVERAESWHNFHKHTDIQCDSICDRIGPAKAAIAKAEER
jgi:hypothetical protein